MKIIAFGHRSRYGKDSAAKFLMTMCKLKSINTRKIAFASKLKQCCYLMFAWAGHQPPQYYDENPAARDIVLEPLGFTPVELWIKFGTQMVRTELHDLTWIKAALDDAGKCDVLIISDLRFLNEVEAIRELGGLILKVDRPGYPKRDSVADNALADYSDWDMVLSATNLTELYAETERVMERFI